MFLPPRASPRASPRPSLDGDDERAHFDAIIVDDESSPRASPTSSPRAPPPKVSVSPHLVSASAYFDSLPAPGEGQPAAGEVGASSVAPPAPPSKVDPASPFDESLDDVPDEA